MVKNKFGNYGHSTQQNTGLIFLYQNPLIKRVQSEAKSLDESRYLLLFPDYC